MRPIRVYNLAGRYAVVCFVVFGACSESAPSSAPSSSSGSSGSSALTAPATGGLTPTASPKTSGQQPTIQGNPPQDVVSPNALSVATPKSPDAPPLPLPDQRAELEAMLGALYAKRPTPPSPNDFTPSRDIPPADLGKLTKLPSGVEYIDLSEGFGPELGARDFLSAHMTLWRSDGLRLDALSTKPNKPLVAAGFRSLPLEGLVEGAQGIRIGARRLLILPPEAAKSAATERLVPPNSLVVVELIITSAAHLDQTLPKPNLDAPSAYDPAQVKTLPSGLKYVDLLGGNSDTPQTGQTVLVHYTGWLQDGKRFDSSVERDEPFAFPLGQGRAIPGMDEGVSTMRKGGKRLLFIPSALGYAERGFGTTIPPKADLIFEVTLYDAL